MKKKLLSGLLCAAMVGSLFVGCGSSSDSAPADDGAAADTSAPAADSGEAETTTGGGAAGTYALVPKSAGNPFNEKEADGFTAAIEAMGGTAVVQYPESATADAQITVIQSLISQGVDSICVAANDENALQAVLEEAMDAGIKVCSVDSSVNKDSRAVHCNQAGVDEIGLALIDAVYDISGGEGQFAILSATSQATNQNAWIDSMKSYMESDSKYADLELVEVAYGDDESQKSTDQTQALLQKYPDLKVICSPTTVGIAAAAKVLQDQGSSVKLTGLGLPSEMAAYIGDGDDYSCPYMFLWNPIDLGALGAYTSVALVNGDITGAAGDTFSCELGDYTVVDAADGGTEIILGAPFKFDPSNIDEWKEVY
ncbi:rhamnose ABC transporter substrate-binding protein [Pseudobutyrivibrio sp.]|jgi:rhamnose transport system substrate-binding protein|uniref:rhamnose ABC transporter substrate-binding protein n=1 Tax=Pseudobutyrivibrio sp. TaxID=2014367 RepID=UPI001D8563FF|nr:rhamnose ABC transporter substrate-binding protein [Pseudobutyrivibrio sp.]MBE5911461.1 autoinducer 2 ABC transporter substrate-binding protein [Pseudobutyrivibrio sp.]